MKQIKFPILVLLALVFLLAPLLLRGAQPFPTPEAYYNVRLAETLFVQGYIESDPAIAVDTVYKPNAFHYFITPFVHVLGPTYAAYFVPIVLGILSLLLLYSLAKKRFARPDVLIGLFILSPLFISTFTALKEEAFVIFLVALSTWLFLRPRTYLLSLPLLFVLGSLSVLHTVVALVLVLIISRRRGVQAHTFLAIITLFFSFVFHFSFSIRESGYSLPSQPVIQYLLFDFGALHGTPVVLILLGIIGTYLLWSHKRKYYLIFFAGFGVVAYSLIDSSAQLYVNGIMLFLGAVAVQKMIERRWKLPIVQYAFLIVVLFSVLSTSISAVQLVSIQEPDRAFIDDLYVLREMGSSQDVVFAHYSQGHYIASIGKKRILLDSFTRRVINAKQVHIDSLELFHTYEEQAIRNLVQKYDIHYVILTPDLEEGIVWEKPGRGLAFTSSNSEIFKRVYNSSRMSIFEVIRDE